MFTSIHIQPVALLIPALVMVAAAEPVTRSTSEDCNPEVFHIQNVGTDDCIALRSRALPSGRSELLTVLELCDSSAKRQQWSQIEADFMVRSDFDSSKCLFPSHGSQITLFDCDDENWMDASWQKYSDNTIRNTDNDDMCWDQHGQALFLTECLVDRQEQLWTSFSSESSCQDFAARSDSNSTSIVNSTLSWFNPQVIEENVNSMGNLGIFYFGLIYVAIEIFCIPAVPLTITAGYLFGMWKGTAVVVVSASIAAGISFNLGRRFLRSWVLRKLEFYPKFRKLDKAVAKDGFRVILLIQMSPFFPFAMGNYFYGTTSVNFFEYWAGTALGITPGSFAYCYSGKVGQTLLSNKWDSTFPWYVYLLILLVIIGLLHLIASTALRILEGLNEDEEEDENLEKLNPIS